MKFKQIALFSTLLMITAVVANCQMLPASKIAFHEEAKNYNGVVGSEGANPTLLKTTVVGIHLIFGIIPAYRATLDAALDQFTREARLKYGGKVKILHTQREVGIFYLPPFTFFITPVFFDIVGEVYR